VVENRCGGVCLLEVRFLHGAKKTVPTRGCDGWAKAANSS
jgi:hypothetical protein